MGKIYELFATVVAAACYRDDESDDNFFKIKNEEESHKA